MFPKKYSKGRRSSRWSQPIFVDGWCEPSTRVRPAVSVQTCIYCLRSSPEVTFNREHVLPEAFGKFKGALTLLREVCSGCNTFFSETLDLTLGRKSIEGLERYRWGVKPAQEIEKFRFDHIQMRAADDGDFKGVPVELYYNAESDSVVARPQPGVSIHNAHGDGFTHFTPEQIKAGNWQ